MSVLIIASFCVCSGLSSVFVSSVFAADAKIFKQAERSLREGQFAEAEALYRQVLSEDEKHLAARLGLSTALLKQRKLQEAYDEAFLVATREPQSARAFALLGMTLLAAGDFPRSHEHFIRAVQFDEREAMAIAGLGMIDYYENRMDSSCTRLRRAVRLAPKESDYLFSLAQASARDERYRDAADAYEQFLRIAPIADEDRRARIRGLIQFLRYVSKQGELYQINNTSRNVIKFELSNNRPIIPVRVNGYSAPLRFVLDSGSGMSVISEEAAAKLNISSVARGGVARAIGGVGRFEIVYGFLRSFSFGAETRGTSSITITNVPVYIRPFYNKENPIDGYIGLSVLANYLTSVDYQNRTLTLQRDSERAAQNRNAAAENAANLPTNFNAPTQAQSESITPSTTDVISTTTDAIEIPARLTTSGFWSSEVQLDGVTKTQNFIIDTGASISVVSEQLAAREEMNRYLQPTRLKIHGAAGITENVPLLLLPRLNFNSRITRHSVPAVVLDMKSINETSGFEQSGIIGGNVLRHYRVTFDFPRMIVRLEPYTKTPRTIKSSESSIAPPRSPAPANEMRD